MNEHYELEDMRQQMATLKKKLEKQEIVNDRMIRQSLKHSTSSINRRYIFYLLSLPGDDSLRLLGFRETQRFFDWCLGNNVHTDADYLSIYGLHRSSSAQQQPVRQRSCRCLQEGGSSQEAG